jgi:hypothetical protein
MTLKGLSGEMEGGSQVVAIDRLFFNFCHTHQIIFLKNFLAGVNMKKMGIFWSNRIPAANLLQREAYMMNFFL